MIFTKYSVLNNLTNDAIGYENNQTDAFGEEETSSYEMVTVASLLFAICGVGVVLATVVDKFKKKSSVIVLDCYADENYPYLVTLRTELAQDSGTTADVAIKLAGVLHQTRWYFLNQRADSSSQSSAVKFGSKDTYLLMSKVNLGTIWSVGVTLYGESEEKNTWALSDISIVNPESGDFWNFPANKKLAPCPEGTHLLVNRSDKRIPFTKAFMRTFAKGFSEYHLWANIICGNHSASQISRGQCSTTIGLFLVNAMCACVYLIDQRKLTLGDESSRVAPLESTWLLAGAFCLVTYGLSLVVETTFRLFNCGKRLSSSEKYSLGNAANDGNKLDNNNEEGSKQHTIEDLLAEKLMKDLMTRDSYVISDRTKSAARVVMLLSQKNEKELADEVTHRFTAKALSSVSGLVEKDVQKLKDSFQAFMKDHMGVSKGGEHGDAPRSVSPSNSIMSTTPPEYISREKHRCTNTCSLRKVSETAKSHSLYPVATNNKQPKNIRRDIQSRPRVEPMKSLIPQSSRFRMDIILNQICSNLSPGDLHCSERRVKPLIFQQGAPAHRQIELNKASNSKTVQRNRHFFRVAPVSPGLNGKLYSLNNSAKDKKKAKKDKEKIPTKDKKKVKKSPTAKKSKSKSKSSTVKKSPSKTKSSTITESPSKSRSSTLKKSPSKTRSSTDKKNSKPSSNASKVKVGPKKSRSGGHKGTSSGSPSENKSILRVASRSKEKVASRQKSGLKQSVAQPGKSGSKGSKDSKEAKKDSPILKKSSSKVFKPIGSKDVVKKTVSVKDLVHIDADSLKNTVIGGEPMPEQEFNKRMEILEMSESRRKFRELEGDHTHFELEQCRTKLAKVKKGHEKEYVKKPVPKRYKEVANQPATMDGWLTCPFDMAASTISPGARPMSPNKPLDRPYSPNLDVYQREFDIGMLLNERLLQKSPFLRGQLPPDLAEKEEYLAMLRNSPKVPSNVRLELERHPLSRRKEDVQSGQGIRPTVAGAEHIRDIFRTHSSGNLVPRSRLDLESIYSFERRSPDDLYCSVSNAQQYPTTTFQQGKDERDTLMIQLAPPRTRDDSSNYFLYPTSRRTSTSKIPQLSKSGRKSGFNIPSWMTYGLGPGLDTHSSIQFSWKEKLEKEREVAKPHLEFERRKSIRQAIRNLEKSLPTDDQGKPIKRFEGTYQKPKGKQDFDSRNEQMPSGKVTPQPNVKKEKKLIQDKDIKDKEEMETLTSKTNKVKAYDEYMADKAALVKLKEERKAIEKEKEESKALNRGRGSRGSITQRFSGDIADGSPTPSLLKAYDSAHAVTPISSEIYHQPTGPLRMSRDMLRRELPDLLAESGKEKPRCRESAILKASLGGPTICDSLKDVVECAKRKFFPKSTEMYETEPATFPRNLPIPIPLKTQKELEKVHCLRNVVDGLLTKLTQTPPAKAQSPAKSQKTRYVLESRVGQKDAVNFNQSANCQETELPETSAKLRRTACNARSSYCRRVTSKTIISEHYNSCSLVTRLSLNNSAKSPKNKKSKSKDRQKSTSGPKASKSKSKNSQKSTTSSTVSKSSSKGSQKSTKSPKLNKSSSRGKHKSTVSPNINKSRDRPINQVQSSQSSNRSLPGTSFMSAPCKPSGDDIVKKIEARMEHRHKQIVQQLYEEEGVYYDNLMSPNKPKIRGGNTNKSASERGKRNVNTSASKKSSKGKKSSGKSAKKSKSGTSVKKSKSKTDKSKPDVKPSESGSKKSGKKQKKKGGGFSCFGGKKSSSAVMKKKEKGNKDSKTSRGHTSPKTSKSATSLKKAKSTTSAGSKTSEGSKGSDSKMKSSASGTKATGETSATTAGLKSSQTSLKSSLKSSSSKTFKAIGASPSKEKKTAKSGLEAGHIDIKAIPQNVVGGDPGESIENFNEHLAILEQVEKRKHHRMKEVAGEKPDLVHLRTELKHVKKGHEKEYEPRPVPAKYKTVASDRLPHGESWGLTPFDMIASSLSPDLRGGQVEMTADRPYYPNPWMFQREFDIGMLLNTRAASNSPFTQGILPPDLDEKEQYLQLLRSRSKIPPDVQNEIFNNPLPERIRDVETYRMATPAAQHIRGIFQSHSSGEIVPRNEERVPNEPFWVWRNHIVPEPGSRGHGNARYEPLRKDQYSSGRDEQGTSAKASFRGYNDSGGVIGGINTINPSHKRTRGYRIAPGTSASRGFLDTSPSKGVMFPSQSVSKSGIRGEPRQSPQFSTPTAPGEYRYESTAKPASVNPYRGSVPESGPPPVQTWRIGPQPDPPHVPLGPDEMFSGAEYYAWEPIMGSLVTNEDAKDKGGKGGKGNGRGSKKGGKGKKGSGKGKRGSGRGKTGSGGSKGKKSGSKGSGKGKPSKNQSARPTETLATPGTSCGLSRESLSTANSDQRIYRSRMIKEDASVENTVYLMKRRLMALSLAYEAYNGENNYCGDRANVRSSNNEMPWEDHPCYRKEIECVPTSKLPVTNFALLDLIDDMVNNTLLIQRLITYDTYHSTLGTRNFLFAHFAVDNLLSSVNLLQWVFRYDYAVSRHRVKYTVTADDKRTRYSVHCGMGSNRQCCLNLESEDIKPQLVMNRGCKQPTYVCAVRPSDRI